LEQGDDPPDLVIDLDRTIGIDLDLNAFFLGIGQREPLTIGADDSGDFLVGHRGLTLGVDIRQVGRARESAIGLGHDQGLSVLTHDDLVELSLPVRGKIGNTVLAFTCIQTPLKIMFHVYLS